METCGDVDNQRLRRRSGILSVALTLCHECGKQMSSDAKACPQCGAPANRTRQRLAEERVRKGLPVALTAQEQRSSRRIGYAALLGLLIVVALYCEQTPEARQSAEASRQAAERAGRESSAKMAAEATVRSRMKDPDGVQFRNVRVVWDGDKGLTCGEYNAKNGFGAYIGFRPFVGNGNLVFTGEDAASLPKGTFAMLLEKCR